MVAGRRPEPDGELDARLTRRAVFWTDDRGDAATTEEYRGRRANHEAGRDRGPPPNCTDDSLTPRRFIRFSAPAAFVLAGLLAPAAAIAAPATCVSATPTVVALDDAAQDAEPGAPELSAIRAQVSADCTVTVRLTVDNRTALRADDALLVYLNTDGDPATGARSFGGGDRGVGIVADEDGPGHLALLGAWDAKAEAIDFEHARELDVTRTGFGFTAGIDELRVRSGGALGISVAALSEPDGEIALDFAPDDEGGALALPVTYATTATAVAPATAGAPPRGPLVRRTCRVPSVKGRTVAAARRAIRAAGCRVGRTRARYGTDVRAGRGVATLPAAGSRIAATRPVTILVAR